MQLLGQRTPRLSLTLVDAAALVVIVAGLRAAAPIVTQFLLIAFIAIIVTPAYFQLVRWRLPQWLALSLLIAGLAVSVLYGITALTRALTQLAYELPEYHRGILGAVAQLRDWLAVRQIELPPNLFDELVQTNARIWTGKLVTAAGGLLGNGFVILLVVTFIVCEAATLPRRLRESQWMTIDVYERLEHVVVDVRHYMGIKTVISMATGFTIYLGLVLLKIDSPLLLGLVAFLLNYVPTIGSIVAGAPGVLIALVRFGFGRAAAVFALYLIVNQLFGSILEPRIMGRGFGVSPVVILLSLVFWGWVLGPVGMLLSVPLTMGLRVVLGSLRETGPLAPGGDGDADAARPEGPGDVGQVAAKPALVVPAPSTPRTI